MVGGNKYPVHDANLLGNFVLLDCSGKVKKTQRHRWLTECCHDNPKKSSQIPKFISTASGSIPPIHGYLLNNKARGVNAESSHLARVE